jgi:hypothetical protein
MTETQYLIQLIHPHDVRRHWPEAKKFLNPAIDMSGGRWTADYVLAGLVLNEQSLWLIREPDSTIVGAITTEVLQYPEKRALALHFIGGEEFEDFYPALYDQLNLYAKQNKCDIVEANGRPGFWKWFKGSGFERTATFYETRVNYE